MLPSGGTIPYQIQWSDGSPQFYNENLLAGTYQFTLTDVQGCTIIDSVSVVHATPIRVQAELGPDQSGEGTAAINLEISGGAGPYSIEWFDGNPSDSIGGLFPGVYAVTISDAFGCELDTSILVPLGVFVQSTSASRFTIFPNPANNKVHVMIESGFVEEIQIELLDMVGTRLVSRFVEPADGLVLTFDVSDLPSGSYLFSLTSGGTQHYQRLTLIR